MTRANAANATFIVHSGANALIIQYLAKLQNYIYIIKIIYFATLFVKNFLTFVA